ncbi:glycosyltransferase [Hoyosella sp. G463]|uniref:Glycosyltransferase n=1 Tax=Lolliginicoccus lacisalsi TaxID=2742202 RepID=A0A927PM56_9ACTN|nr:glycosyltransferase [Lolliginicoccus lacisalsi]MBD8507588.1 glycosyltransferase [Lolliginicoccus lacisalsi]
MSLTITGEAAAARSALPDGDEPIVIIAVHGSYDDVVRCYESFLRETDASIPLLVIDDASPDARVVTVLDGLLQRMGSAHTVVVLRQPENLGFVGSANNAFAVARGRDVVILNSDTIVGPEWVPRLQAAARSSSTIATATALTNHGTIVSVGADGKPASAIPGGHDPREAAIRVARAATRTRPRLPTGIGHCLYITRRALDVVGGFDDAFAPGYGEEVDFCQRALAHGLQHVVADDVFIYHRGGASFGESPRKRQLQAAHERIIAQRYPYYHPWVRKHAGDEGSMLAAALLTARAALAGLHIAVDGTCLGARIAGTQVNVLATTTALARHPGVARVTLYTQRIVPQYARDATEGIVGLQLRTMPRGGVGSASKAHAVIRPYQVQHPGELDVLRGIAHRVVVTCLDLIAHDNPAYFAAGEEWQRYRSATRAMFREADAIGFLSGHVVNAARAEGLLDGEVPHGIVGSGTDHVIVPEAPAARPSVLEEIEPGYVLVLGSAYSHKNRPFAIALHQQMQQRGFRGQLVLCGASPAHGSTLFRERELLARPGGPDNAVVTLGSLPEEHKAWLYQNAGLVLYPTLSEGFGLVPFEAAHHGVPVLSTRSGSLDEVLPRGIPTIDALDAAQVAAMAMELLRDKSARDDLIDRLLDHATTHSWARTADALVELTEASLGRPPRSGDHGHAGQGGASGMSRAIGELMDSTVMLYSAMPGAREAITPQGSRREQAARRVLGTIRRAT